MASERMVFGTHAESIQHLFSDAKIVLPNELYQDLLRFLSKACGYEEEERKIRPSIIIGHNLQDSSLQKILQSTLIPLVKDRMDSTHLSKRLKSTLPFCNNGWRVYIDIGDECITYGIMRNFNGPTGVNIEEILCGLSDDELLAMNVHFILIDIVSNYEVLLKGNGRECMIDFRLIADETEVNANAGFCQDILSACESERSKASIAYSKIVKLFSQKLHGCICVIIKHDYELPDTVLKDGIFLENPIDICSILTDELNDKQLM